MYKYILDEISADYYSFAPSFRILLATLQRIYTDEKEIREYV